MRSLESFLLFGGCATFSLYLLPVGQIQLAHVLLAMAAFVAILSDRISFSREAVLLTLLAAVALVRETFAVLAGAPTNSLVQPVFILFNVAVFVGVYTIYSHSRSAESYKWGITVAIAIALFSLLLTGIQLTGSKIEERAIGSFQNPNQLAYFASIMFSTTVLLYTFGRIGTWLTAALVVAILLLGMAAQSKAGIIGITIGLAGLLAGNASTRIWAAAAVAVVVLLSISGVLDIEQLLVLRRLQDIGADPDDSFAARGYLVLVDNSRDAFDVLLGLGAGGVRFVHYHEIHSTYASYFGLYGIIGGSLYLSVLASWVWRVFRTVPFTRFVPIVGPPLFYGIAHNGTRFSILYAFIAMSVALCEEHRRSTRRVRSEPLPGWMLGSDVAQGGRTGMPDRVVREGWQG